MGEMEIKISKEAYGGWPNCYRLSNGIVDLVVTTDVGPRIIRFGFVDGENEFKEYAEMLGHTGGDEWRIYGGHRLWVAPEDRAKTYAPDNSPVRFDQRTDFVRMIQETDASGIQKEIDIRLSEDAPLVEVTHRLHNRTGSPVELAPWAISVMAPGGKAVIPFPPRASHEGSLLPTSRIVLWAYTDMTDRRWSWGQRLATLRQDSESTTPQKAGFTVPDRWAAYERNGNIFLKQFEHFPDEIYPDFGCSVEVFTNSEMLELETLGPLVRLAPGETVEHFERWQLFRDLGSGSEGQLSALLRPRP